MKGGCRVFRKKNRQGMTLVEVVLFMTLALFVLGGSFPLISRLRYADLAHEKRLAAINFANTTCENLRATTYATLTSGYTKDASTSGTVYYDKYYNATNFYKTATLDMRVRLYEETDPTLKDYYRGEIRLQWDSKLSLKKTERQEEIITVLLFPDV